MRKKLVDDSYDAGWLSPKGKFYCCDESMFNVVAKYYFKQDEKTLLDKGWRKITAYQLYNIHQFDYRLKLAEACDRYAYDCKTPKIVRCLDKHELFKEYYYKEADTNCCICGTHLVMNISDIIRGTPICMNCGYELYNRQQKQLKIQELKTQKENNEQRT